jgi:phage shock protein C
MIRTEHGAAQAGLYRDPAAGWLAGVCAGLADRLGVAVGLVRLVFLVLAVGGAFVPAAVLYGLLAFLMPARPLLDAASWSRRGCWYG